jgi:hypothetical protein
METDFLPLDKSGWALNASPLSILGSKNPLRPTAVKWTAAAAH